MQQFKTIWLVLMGSVMLFGALCFVLPVPPGAQPQMSLLFGIGVSAVVEVVVSFVLPANSLKTAFRDFDAETVESPGDDSSMFGGQPGPRKVFKHPARALRLGRARYYAPFILGLALSEAVALDGFVLNRVGFRLAAFLPFLVVGLVLVAIRFPGEGKIVAAIEKQTGARFPATPGAH